VTDAPLVSGHVVVVTDSTAYLPSELVSHHGILVVPLQVALGGTAYNEAGGTLNDAVSAQDKEHAVVQPEAVAEALRNWLPVTTSRPAPGVFLDVYRQLADVGAVGVASIHLSSAMSGTYAAASLAARQAPLPVRVVDSQSLGMGLGYPVIAAARTAAAGAGLDQVVSAAERLVADTTAFFYVDTLDYLRRGGRIGAAQALLGSALAIKPILHLVDGHIQPWEKVRTASRAMARLEELALTHAAHRDVDVAVHHLADPERAEGLAERLRHRLTAASTVIVCEVGAVVGAHVGPGMLAIAIAGRASGAD
jgi:DegV family protein with EDD domain